MRYLRPSKTTLAALLALSMSTICQAQIAKCVDNDGLVTFSNVACPFNEVTFAAIDEVQAPVTTNEIVLHAPAKIHSERGLAGLARASSWAHVQGPVRNSRFPTDTVTILQARLALQLSDRLAALSKR
jgi:hypothetical protein